MTKKQLILTIDEDVVDKAKKQIPNISACVEKWLKQYLGIANNLIPTSKMHELIDTISKCQLELHIMTEQKNIEEMKQQAKLEEINFAWRKVYTEYRDTRTFNQGKLKHTANTLNVSAEELKDIVEVLFTYRDSADVDVTDWFEVYKEYGYGDDE